MTRQSELDDEIIERELARAQELRRTGRPQQALGLLLELQERAGDNVAVISQLAGLYFEQERYADAVRWYVRLLRIDPRCDGAAACMFSALLHLDKPIEAFEFVVRYAERGPSQEVRSILRDLVDEPDAVSKMHLSPDQSSRVFELIARLRSLQSNWQ